MSSRDELWLLRVRRGLVVAGGVVGLAGLVAELLHKLRHRLWFEPYVAFFSLSFERNLPTWYSSSLLLLCALALASVVEHLPSDARHRTHWKFLSLVFAYLSLDEAVELHEHFGRGLHYGGLLYFSWIVPAGLLCGVFLLSYLRFLRALSKETRRAFVVSGVVYVCGALVMELPLGWWTERHGDDNLGYALLDWIEEVMELAGASMFLLAVLRERAMLQRESTKR